MSAELDLRGIVAETKREKGENAITKFVNNQIGNVMNPVVPFEIGKSYFVRTVTMVDVGQCVAVAGKFVCLKDAAWIADTGRFNECLKDPKIFNEVEPFDKDIWINSDSIIDFTEWPYVLPTKAK